MEEVCGLLEKILEKLNSIDLQLKKVESNTLDIMYVKNELEDVSSELRKISNK